jgi:hypothetical protein
MFFNLRLKMTVFHTAVEYGKGGPFFSPGAMQFSQKKIRGHAKITQGPCNLFSNILKFLKNRSNFQPTV